MMEDVSAGDGGALRNTKFHSYSNSLLQLRGVRGGGGMREAMLIGDLDR